MQIPAIIDPQDKRIAIFTAEWNWDVTGKLREGALDVLRKAGVPEANILDRKVPGTVELVNAAAMALNCPGIAAVA